MGGICGSCVQGVFLFGAYVRYLRKVYVGGISGRCVCDVFPGFIGGRYFWVVCMGGKCGTYFWEVHAVRCVWDILCGRYF